MKCYHPQTILSHWKRFSKDPSQYSQVGQVFPARLGRPRVVSDNEEILIINKIKQRLKEKHLRYPNLLIFQQIIENDVGLKLSLSTINRICIRNSFVYGPPLNSKSGTRYHDSELVLEERKTFLLKKLFYLAWETKGKLEIFSHDESWVAEKPSGIRLWSYDSPSGKETVNPGNKIGGRRIAFSSNFSKNSGLLPSVDRDILLLLHQNISTFKQKLDQLGDYGVSEFCELAEKCNIPSYDGMTVDSKNRLVYQDTEDQGFFYFLCATASQNKGISRQMNGRKFLWSIEKMIKSAHLRLESSISIVLQLDNATYHREPQDLALRKIIHPYPLLSKSNTIRICMLDKLKEWNFKPSHVDNTWFNVIYPLPGRITKNTSPSVAARILARKKEIAVHKADIQRYF